MILRPAAPLPPASKSMKMMTANAFLMILKPVPRPSASSKTMKMKSVLCISHDSKDSGPPLAQFQNHENDYSPCISLLRFWTQPPPLPPTSKTMKIRTVLCICCDSEALRPLPRVPPRSSLGEEDTPIIENSMLSIVFLEVRGDGGARPTTQIIENIVISIFSCLELRGDGGAAPTAQIIENILIYTVF